MNLARRVAARFALEQADRYRKPKALHRGDRIVIIAPASVPDPEETALAMDLIRDHGFEPVLGDNVRCLRSRGMVSAPHEQRLAELQTAIDDPSLQAVIVATGGVGCGSLLPGINWESMRRSPKPFMGYSDVTVLNNAMLAVPGVVSFHGPTASVRAFEEKYTKFDQDALGDALDLLQDPSPWGSRPWQRNPKLPRCLRPGTATGPSIGGNITMFEGLIGTPFMPNVDGAILFLETVDLEGYELSLSLTHMALAGIFGRVAGVVLGEFSRIPESADQGDPSVEEVVAEFFENGPPCVVGYNFSHGDTTACIPMGTPCRLVADEPSVEFGCPLVP
jgi:muramoyltetrapeptide carboxypeptidase